MSRESPSGSDSIAYAPDEGVYRTSFDSADVDPSLAVVDVLAAISDSEPATLEPLYNSIDPDALDQLFESHDAAARTSDFSVQFAHAGHEIALSSDGTVEVRPL